MKIFLLTTLLTSSIFSSPAQPGARITGGTDALPGQYPFAASIQKITASGRFFCGGALLNSRWILTAGSCIVGARSFSIRLGMNGNDTNLIETTSDYFTHPDYHPESFDNDIALIQLQISVEFSDYVQPIQLPTTALLEDSVVTSINWFDDNLQNVELVVVSNEECRLYFGIDNINTVCVTGNYNQGICLGDVGVPLIQYVDNVTATVVGVSIFPSLPCESTDPSVFTRVFPYVDWIRNHIEAA